jgi:hypothetical protein
MQNDRFDLLHKEYDLSHHAIILADVIAESMYAQIGDYMDDIMELDYSDDEDKFTKIHDILMHEIIIALHRSEIQKAQ